MAGSQDPAVCVLGYVETDRETPQQNFCFRTETSASRRWASRHRL